MHTNEATGALWSKFSAFIAETMGLHFSLERWGDLQRGLVNVAQELGQEDVAGWAEALMAAPPDKARLDLLAGHLTIGETYFFRDKATFDALGERILPELIQARRSRERRLRLWSAACCTGEEAYSIAMLLHELLPDLKEWHVTILATDINPRFLRKAATGVYGEWSFRVTPSWVRDRFCMPVPDGRHAVRPEVKRMVTFASLNLVDDVYPSLASDTNAMDVIFCRNVLMYFATPQVRRVVGRLHRTLVEGGWLVVSPSEASHALFGQFGAVNAPGVILYRKSLSCETTVQSSATHSWETPWEPSALTLDASAPALEELVPAVRREEPEPDVEVEVKERGEPMAEQRAPHEIASALYEQGRYAEAVECLLAATAGRAPAPEEFALLAQALANQGRLDEALKWCDRWIAAEKLDAVARYLRAIVLFEQGTAAEAWRSLSEALYLRPDFILAHVAFGQASRARGHPREARRHFTNALRLLARCERDESVPESDGLSAGRLSEMITTLLKTDPMS
ncbi:MAG TPA: CheR family methyltransferase [Opitutaceae bacterium]